MTLLFDDLGVVVDPTDAFSSLSSNLVSPQPGGELQEAKDADKSQLQKAEEARNRAADISKIKDILEGKRDVVSQEKGKKEPTKKTKKKDGVTPVTGGSNREQVTDENTGVIRNETAQERRQREELERVKLLQEKMKTISMARKGKGDQQKADREEQKFKFDLFEKGLELDAMNPQIAAAQSQDLGIGLDGFRAESAASPLLRGLGAKEDPGRIKPEDESMLSKGERAVAALIPGNPTSDDGTFGTSASAVQTLANLATHPGNAQSPFTNSSGPPPVGSDLSQTDFETLKAFGPMGVALSQRIQNPQTTETDPLDIAVTEQKKTSLIAPNRKSRFAGTVISDEEIQKIAAEMLGQKTMKGVNIFSGLLGTATNLVTAPFALFSDDLRKTPIGTRIFGQAIDPGRRLEMIGRVRHMLDQGRSDTRFRLGESGAITATSSNLDDVMAARELGDRRYNPGVRGGRSRGGKSSPGSITPNAFAERQGIYRVGRAQIDQRLADNGSLIGQGPAFAALRSWKQTMVNMDREKLNHPSALVQAGIGEDLKHVRSRLGDFFDKQGPDGREKFIASIEDAKKVAFEMFLDPDRMSFGDSKFDPVIMGEFGQDYREDLDRFQTFGLRVLDMQESAMKGEKARTEFTTGESAVLDKNSPGVSSTLQKFLNSPSLPTDYRGDDAGSKAIAALLNTKNKAINLTKSAASLVDPSFISELLDPVGAIMEGLGESTEQRQGWGTTARKSALSKGKGGKQRMSARDLIGGVTEATIGAAFKSGNRRVDNWQEAMILFANGELNPSRSFFDTMDRKGIPYDADSKQFVSMGPFKDVPFWGQVESGNNKFPVVSLRDAVTWSEKAMNDPDVTFTGSKKLQSWVRQADRLHRHEKSAIRAEKGGKGQPFVSTPLGAKFVGQHQPVPSSLRPEHTDRQVSVQAIRGLALRKRAARNLKRKQQREQEKAKKTAKRPSNKPADRRDINDPIHRLRMGAHRNRKLRGDMIDRLLEQRNNPGHTRRRK